MVKISHFKHDHPLIILKQFPQWLTSSDAKKGITCYGCHKPIPWGEDGEDVYGCVTCKTFFLHESCVDFPNEIRHSVLERHSFLLQSINPHPSSLMYCLHCGYSKKEALIYESQSDAGYGLHIKCAFKDKESVVAIDKDLTLNHPSHKHHTLKLQPRLSSFHCDAFCGFEDKDFSYQCSSCPYLIHRRCALLPKETEWRDGHPHQLSLSFGLPSEYHETYLYFCDLCRGYLDPTDKAPRWLYYCNLCTYFVHISCMTPQKLQNRVHLDSVYAGDSLPRLPADDNSVELIQPFVVRENNNSFVNVQPEIQIFSHKHLLTLSHKQILGNDTEGYVEVECDACIEPILSPPYYHCAKCSYFLHLHCANFPSKLNQQSHPHPLILGSRRRFYDNFICNFCMRYSNGFYYFCEIEECRFHIDVKCAVLPSFVKHQTHIHRLRHSFRPSDMYSCRACNVDIYHTNYYTSESYPLVLHERCALLPKTVRHNFDNKHPLILKFPPHSYHPTPFDCAQCEKEIHRKYWLYHCKECDLSFHVYCVNRTGEFDNYKCGQKLQINDIHQHPLKFVRKASINSPCQRCEEDINKDVAFECQTCNFHLCRRCVLTIQP